MPTHYKGVEEEVHALNSYINLIRASNSVLDRVRRSLDTKGFTVSQFEVLDALYHLGPLNQKDLALKVLKTSGNLTTVISNLMRQDLVTRSKDTKDERYILIDLTDKGRDLIHKMFYPHALFITRLMKILDFHEQETLRHLCRKLGRGVSSVT